MLGQGMVLVIEALEERQQNAGAQQPHGQIPGRVEAAVQSVGEHQEADADRAAEQMRELENRQRHHMMQYRQAIAGRGRGVGNSSTAPAPNTASALACGVSALNQVRPSCPIRTNGALVRPQFVRAEQGQRRGERGEIINDAKSQSSAPSSSSAGTARNSNSSTDSNTPTPPGTLLMMPAAIAMRNSPANGAKPIEACGGKQARIKLRRRTTDRRRRRRVARRRCPGAVPE